MSEKFLKLTNKVYGVLEFFPESDPLKSRAKDKALLIMEHLISINETSGWLSFGKEKIKVQLLEDIDILLGYLWIGKSQGWLNSVNCLIITNEYENLKKEIKPIVEPIIELTQKLPGIEKQPILNKITQIRLEENFNPVLDNIETKPQDSFIPDRQKKILEFLNKNGKAQVMDLQKILPNITKRTIRRDLDELLGADKIARMGEFNQVFYKAKG